MPPEAIVAGFLASAIAVVVAGTVLARNADVIAARTRLGGLWVGTVMLAAATSLPELTTDISAVHIGAPDLAAGDLFGSSLANMLILAVVSMAPGADLFRKAALENALSASLAIVLTAVAAIAILMRSSLAIMGIGIGSILLAVLYVAGARAIFRHTSLLKAAGETIEMTAPRAEAEADEEPAIPALRVAIIRFVLASVAILVSGPIFAMSAEGLAELTGLGSSFVGTWLVGLATSLPELVTSLAAVRIAAYDLAVGNLFGSNAANMLMFVVLDAVHTKGPILGAIEQVHALTALGAIVLMAIGLYSIVFRAQRRFSLSEPSSVFMILVYLAVLGLVFTAS